MAQILAFVAATASISGVMLGLVLRSMSALRNELSNKIDGLHHGLGERIDRLRNEMNAKFDGLRFEMNVRLEPLARDADRLDNDGRQLKKEISKSVKPQLT